MLNKRNRLTKRGSFTYVYKKGGTHAQNSLRITFVRSNGAPRVGISVPNSVGKAVVRNKVRRRIRAAMRTLISDIRPSQFVISAKSGAENMTYAQIESTLRELLIRSGLYEKKEDNGGLRN